MMMCTVEEVNHHFHKECIKEIDGTLYCPHCGENASLAKEVTLPSTEALDQLKCVPQTVLLNGSLKLPRVLLARLTGMSSKALAFSMGEEEDIQTPKYVHLHIYFWLNKNVREFHSYQFFVKVLLCAFVIMFLGLI